MSLAATVATRVVVVDTSENEFVSPDNPSTTFQMTTSQELTSATTPPVTKHAPFELTLTAGAATIDLTSLPDTEGVAGAVTFLGLKVQVAKFTNPASNANDMTIALGASNGHPLFTASGITLAPGQSWTFENLAVDVGTDVAAGDRTWDVTGTGAQVLNVYLVAG